jgi:hypothetical protein
MAVVIREWTNSISILFTITLSLYNVQKHEQIKYVNI